MNIKFFLLAFAVCGLQVQAKSFRGENDFLKSFVNKINALKSDAHEIAGESTSENPTHEGDIGHAATRFDADVQKTAKIIEKQLAIGMRTNFIFIKEALRQYADDDGIVRDGVVFCNGKNDADESIAFDTKTPTEADYAVNTENLVPTDGFGVPGEDGAEGTQCGRSNCEEGSFVTLLANRIRSLGYHVTHRDICEAKNDDGYKGVPTCALARLGTNSFRSQKCNEATDVAGKDFYSIKKECFMSSDCDGNDDCKPITENGKKHCVPDMTNNTNCAINNIDDIVVEGDDSSTPVINAVRRVIQYGTQTNKVKATDVAYVTGAKEEDGGCKSLRQYVVALNGAAQIAAFRDTNILEAEAHWEAIIEHTRSYLKSYAEILNDFYDKSTQIFPVIEFEEIDACPVGNVEFRTGDRGNTEVPLCDQKDTDATGDQRALDLEGQILVRKRCFCRQGIQLRESGNALSGSNAYEFDELYLMTKAPTTADCEVYKTNDAPSYYQYCTGNSFDDRTWRKTLGDLLPMKHSIKVFGTGGNNKDELFNNLGATLPDDWNSDTNRTEIHKIQSCGRMISTDKTTAVESNKGGNCVPFRGLHEILYRLEFETSQNKQGEQKNCDGIDKDCTFAQVACKESNALENTLYSFRQFTYVWDHPMYKKLNGTGGKTVPVQPNSLSGWEGIFDTFNVSATGTSQYQNSWSDNVNKLFRKADNKQMCNINWGLQLTGDVAREDAAESKYEDPYDLFRREIAEAIVNVEIAIAAKTDAIEDSDTLWSKITEQLTSFGSDSGGIASDLSTEVAEHFMRITTTDDDDDRVTNITTTDGETDALDDNADALDDNADASDAYMPDDMTGTAYTATSGLTAEQCRTEHDSRPGTTSEERCLAGENCVYDDVYDDCSGSNESY